MLARPSFHHAPPPLADELSCMNMNGLQKLTLLERRCKRGVCKGALP
jgi:hypothetical protein